MSDKSHDELAQELLGQPFERLSDVQKSVIDLIACESPTGAHPHLAPDDRTFWERLADHVAAIGGSWSFIFGFFIFLMVWLGWNVVTQHFRLAFDIYPFIFLNLILSMLAAIQAPVIMMSQNRAAAKDREAAEHDSVVNLRAELEILQLHRKMDHMREQQLEELIRGQGETLELLRGQVAALSEKLAEEEI